ncbi:hypothetical protein BVRB_8g200770 isoform B [Beta vulgaris subsp. vulgaris]|uniref:WRKY domain-containing protein n=1 Tax=Beta vulgaris subsp. vulgaris TaxID=3555 RepID=A0A0J8B6S4_BETVV|nr:hypothetical protein BVRB_8g200770 isoform B [Beta vulgaris subsp. vulgaris]
MEDYQGDLADIVRASGGTIGSRSGTSATTAATTTTTTNGQISKWRFGSSNQDYHQSNVIYPFPADNTLLHDMDAISTSTSFIDMGVDDIVKRGGGGGGGGGVMGPVSSGPSNNSLCSIFSSNMVQISPSVNNNNITSSSNDNSSNNSRVRLPGLQAVAASSPKVRKERSYEFMSNQMISISNNASCSSPKDGGFIDANCGGSRGVQISSPRNQGIKRRKIQAKKVVCIPAPAVANSRQTGEVVPSDLWAWRKYGQKPIKGSPYPRCSSSKGCSARKQVERSRTDPNMLVITYTSEHNHPWPTQRNALAGSTRSSQPSKTSSKLSPPSHKHSNNNFQNVLVNDENNQRATTPTFSINEEEDNKDEDIINKSSIDNDNELFNNSYRPLIMAEPITNGGQQVDQDFFADLVEFEGDDTLGLDPFTGLFDWATNNTNTTPITNVQDNDHTTV